MEDERNGTDGLDIGRHIVTTHTVTTGNGLYQTAVLIGQRDRQSVVLQFTTHLEGLTIEPALHTLVPDSHILLIVGIGQRQHRIAVLHLSELLVQIAADTLSRRVGIR